MKIFNLRLACLRLAVCVAIFPSLLVTYKLGFFGIFSDFWISRILPIDFSAFFLLEIDIFLSCDFYCSCETDLSNIYLFWKCYFFCLYKHFYGSRPHFLNSLSKCSQINGNKSAFIDIAMAVIVLINLLH